jgi:ABC transporter substrate binding protein
MTKFALYVPLEAKPGKEKEVADFLRSAVPLVNAEVGTISWFAIQEGPARAQQSAMPVIGYLGSSSFERSAGRSLLNFKRGLAETGYVEDRNVTIEYRWADDQYERLPALAVELVQRRVAVLVAAGSPTALPAKAATTVIPTVFMVASDPVELGLVASLNRPGGNLTGVAYLNAEVAKLVSGVVRKGLGCEDACIVDDMVDRAELTDRGLCDLLSRRGLTDVPVDEREVR